MHYIDTSVLTAYYCPEPRSARVQRLLSKIDGPTISPLVEVEFHCAVARKVRAGDLDPADARRIFAQFQAHLTEPRYHHIPIGVAEYTQARDWIAQLTVPLRVLDALHLAAASAHTLPLLTADRVLAQCARHLGVEHKLIG